VSLLPTPEEFDDEYDDDRALEAKLPDRPITSLRDLQYVYGQLYTLATAGSGEYAAYLTPEQAQDLLGESESLFFLQVDLSEVNSGGKPRLDRETPIEVTSYDEDDIRNVGHCWYNSARGIDHSITHRTGRDKSEEKIGEYLYERLTRWATDEVVQEVADDHEDGWIVDALAQLGEEDALEERIVDAVEDQIEGTTTALTTVKVRFDSDGEYLFPGECETDVFDEAMRARKRAKLVSKGEATESAGEATDLITGERTRTVGTAEDPLNYFLGKQLEKFPGFDPDEAWRTHPVSEDVAVTLMNAQPFVDLCTYRTLGADVYYLPYYFGRLSAEKVRMVYQHLYAVLESEERTPVEDIYRSLTGDDRAEDATLELRFYVTAVMKHQSKRFDVFGDTLDGSILYPVELAENHVEVLRTWAFDEEIPMGGLRPALPTHPEWALLSGENPLNYIARGWYFENTFAELGDEQDASADDYRIKALIAALSGEPLDVGELLAQYVERLLDDENEQFPSFRVSSQFAQLCALAETDLLDYDEDEYESLTQPPDYDTTDPMTNATPVRADGGATAAQARETKLAQFLEQTPALSQDQPERRGSFLLGALVGQVSSYQQASEGRSTTMVDQYPIKAMTESKLKRLAADVLDKDIVYSRENSMASTMYGEVVDRLVATLPRIEGGSKSLDGEDLEWSLDTTDLRFYYALGVAYGMNNWTDTDADETDTEDST
jgi:CRISPR-associated protein Cas8b/Csh1 subtype I-B